MIIVKAPMRISFVGGGSDLPDFYRQHPGKVISSAINKYVYTIINPAPLLPGTTVRYSITEVVKDIKKLKNNRVREALKYFNIRNKLEIGIFSDLPVGTGLGGSSSFSVGLAKGLLTYLGKNANRESIANAACHLEIDLVGDPIGRQDQYASTYGGFNIFQFNKDDSVGVEPLYIDYKVRTDFSEHCLLFFTGATRKATSVLKEQKAKTNKNINNIKSMTKLVNPFRKNLLKGNYKRLGTMLHKNWLLKKRLASKISNPKIEKIYNTAIKSGAWGGKILGAGAGGCILFVVPPEKQNDVRRELDMLSKKLYLNDFREIPFNFVQSGVDVVINKPLN